MPTLPRYHQLAVKVDWTGAGDGSFPGEADDVTSHVRSDPGLSVERGRDQARSLAPPMIAAADFVLGNDGQRFSGDFAASPVYQQVLPGRDVQVSATWGTEVVCDDDLACNEQDMPADGVATWQIFRGLTESLEHDSTIGARVLRIASLGAAAKLRGRTVSCALQANIRTDQAVAAILDAAGWPADKRAISIGDTTLLYWWADERDAWDALVELVASEGAGAAIYEDGAGILHFENRNYRVLATRSNTTQATYFDQAGGPPLDCDVELDCDADVFANGTTSGLFYRAIKSDPGFRSVVNRATIRTRRRSFGSLQVVWQYGATINLTPNQVFTLFARPRDPFQGAITPVAGTDYTVTAGSVSVTLSFTNGSVAILKLTAGGSGATIAGFQLRAQPLTVVSETTVENTVDASSSIARYGTRSLDIQAWKEIDPAHAQAICDSVVARYMAPRPLVEMTVVNADSHHMRELLDREIGDRVAAVEPHYGTAADFWIEKVTHHISSAGRLQATTYGLEKAADLAGAAWDSAIWDTSTWGS